MPFSPVSDHPKRADRARGGRKARISAKIPAFAAPRGRSLARGVEEERVVDDHHAPAVRRRERPPPDGSDDAALDRLVAEGRLIPTLEAASAVTYHDPCYLGRHNGIYEAPRRVLQSIPGLKLVEMPNNRDRSLCCGGGGGGAWSDYPPDRGLGGLRVKEALDTGAEVIATACPYCIRILNEAVRKLGVENHIVVRDLAELLWESVVMRDEAFMPERVEPGFDQEVCHV